MLFLVQIVTVQNPEVSFGSVWAFVTCGIPSFATLGTTFPNNQPWEQGQYVNRYKPVTYRREIAAHKLFLQHNRFWKRDDINRLRICSNESFEDQVWCDYGDEFVRFFAIFALSFSLSITPSPLHSKSNHLMGVLKPQSSNMVIGIYTGR